VINGINILIDDNIGEARRVEFKVTFELEIG